MSHAKCVCCELLLRFPPDVACFQCAVCKTIIDIDSSSNSNSSSNSIAATTTTATTKPPSHSQIDHEIVRMTPDWIAQLRAFSGGDDLIAGVHVAEAFASPIAFRRSFPLNFEDARATVAVLVKIPVAATALIDGFESLLKRPRKPLRTEDDIAFLHILFEIPDIILAGSNQNAVRRTDLLQRIFGLISSLDKQTHQSLITLFAALPTPAFKRRIELASQFISAKLALSTQSQSRDASYVKDWGIRAAARVLALLFTSASMRRDTIDISDFYCTMVDYVDLMGDFHRWQDPSKMHILEGDAREQMVLRFRDAFVRTAFRGEITDPFMSITVRRSHLISDSLNQIQAKTADLKKKLRIEFADEEGVDAGGLTKEWFLLLVRQLFDPQYGMFTFDEDSKLCWFNQAGFENAVQFQLVGTVVGLSLYNTTIIDVQLPLACFKKLLNVPVDLSDLAILHPALARGLQLMLDYTEDDIEQVFCRTFVAEFERFGEVIQVPLVPNGENILVNHSNKKQFVDLLVDWILNKSVAEQFAAFKDGFNHVCGGNALSLFRPEEIELMVRGSSHLDFEGLQLTADLDGFKRDEDTLKWFWQIITAFSEAMKRKFLLFVTGTDRVPPTGLEALRIKLSCMGDDSEKLPVAHTCFNQICLYRYASKQKLETKLVQAIEWSSGFLVK
eukprot:jgi/Hompol1/7063/HPOL_002422-RA